MISPHPTEKKKLNYFPHFTLFLLVKFPSQWARYSFVKVKAKYFCVFYLNWSIKVAGQRGYPFFFENQNVSTRILFFIANNFIYTLKPSPNDNPPTSCNYYNSTWQHVSIHPVIRLGFVFVILTISYTGCEKKKISTISRQSCYGSRVHVLLLKMKYTDWVCSFSDSGNIFNFW